MKFWEAAFVGGFPFPFYGDNFMKRILLFLLLICYFSGYWVFGQPSPELPPPIVPNEVQFDMLIDVDGIFDILLEVLSGFFAEYYGLLIGFFVAYFFWGYIQGMLESKKERLLRKQAERKVEEKRLLQERELISRYAKVDSEMALRIQNEMYRKESKESVEEELALAPSDGVSGNNVVRNTYWGSDGIVESGNSFSEDTVRIGNSTTVTIRVDKRGRYHRSMEEDGDYSGY
jgi:hypothetical protein